MDHNSKLRLIRDLYIPSQAADNSVKCDFLNCFIRIHYLQCRKMEFCGVLFLNYFLVFINSGSQLQDMNMVSARYEHGQCKRRDNE